jgi:hypothetical protein
VHPGHLNNAVQLSGAPLVVPLNLKPKIDRAFTVAFWIKSDPNPEGNLINANIVFGFSLDMVQGSIRFNAQEKWFYGGTNNASMLGDWTHFAITSDGKTLTVYRDGYLMLTAPAEKAPQFAETLVLGGDGFHGMFDDFRVYDRALDHESVQRLSLLSGGGPTAKRD